MRKLARCSRGSVAFATVIALVPLIGFVALGAEAGSWYVTKQNAQNAADAAAYSGGLSLACSLSTGSDCDNSQDYVYRGKQLAAQNAFCNSTGDPAYPGSTCGTPQANTTRTVSVDRGTYSAGVWTSSASGQYVIATVAQQQPGYLAQMFGMSTVNIRASAIVQIQDPKPVCAFGLGPGSDALNLGGSSIISGTGCAMMSNTNVKYNGTPSFSGSGWAVNAVDGCKAPSGHCALTDAGYNYNMPTAKNPLSVLDTKSFNSRSNPVTSPCGGRVNNNQTCSLTPNSAGGVYGSLTVNSGGTLNLAAGTYFFYDATINFGGTVTGTSVTLVLLGTTSSLTISGGTVNLSAPTTNSFDSDLNGVLIDDQAKNTATPNKVAVTIGGSNTSTLGGAMYFPNADVTYGGTAQSSNTACTEVIAASLTISGNTYLSSSGCTSNTLGKTKIIAMVR
ncbi:pilus assembly protein TadG [Bradyrhizobium sp. KBS0727]|uniref:pilus assembly protein TadG-related protein n=1 Tax=unclassified Bradyrhizobium TaxID=2631580 RepID=UPI00110F4A72|nr:MULTISPECIES: pilus assembly protein TadG-related protein [unclassified Bradyrhizobium]QDW36938.1 pilus assembly protein TadG [Bradyrhizobium sp. KBS0725]QDW43538.1 pilus assembly protein TadG [Bradyrhizobium sp. KBS0727]